MNRRRLARAAWAALLCAGEVALDLAEDVRWSARAIADDVRSGCEDIAADAVTAWRSV